MGIFTMLLVGVLAGYLAEKLMKFEMPLWQNLLVGLGGGALGSIVLELIGANSPTGLISGVLVALAGSCLILWCYRKIKKV